MQWIRKKSNPRQKPELYHLMRDGYGEPNQNIHYLQTQCRKEIKGLYGHWDIVEDPPEPECCPECFREKDYINFGDFCRNEIGMQCQYGSHYLCGTIPDYPKLGEGLRYTGSESDYHSIRIHKDDAPIFKERMMKWSEEHRI